MLWFVEGSGGESHLRRSCRNWLPVRMLESADPVLLLIDDDERFT